MGKFCLFLKELSAQDTSIFLVFLSLDDKFPHTFLVTVKSLELKLVKHKDSGWIYHLYLNHDATA